MFTLQLAEQVFYILYPSEGRLRIYFCRKIRAKSLPEQRNPTCRRYVGNATVLRAEQDSDFDKNLYELKELVEDKTPE